MNSNNFKHLDLIEIKKGKPRRPFFPKDENPIVKYNRENYYEHGNKISMKSKDIFARWEKNDKERQDKELPTLPADKPITLKVLPEEIDIDFLKRAFKFDIVSENDDGVIIVATEPINMKKFIKKVEEFSEGKKRTGQVAKVLDIIDDDHTNRLKMILSEEIFKNWSKIISNKERIVVVELGISCEGVIKIGNKPKQDKFEEEQHYEKRIADWEKRKLEAYIKWDDLKIEREDSLERFLNAYDGEILSNIDNENYGIFDSFSVIAKMPIKCLEDIVYNYPYVFEVIEPEQIGEYNINNIINGQSNPKFEIIEPNSKDPIVAVIDSGIQEGHAYIEKAIKKELSKSFLKKDNETSDKVTDGGHGTRVAGAILYPNGIPREDIKEYQLPCNIANYRVLNENNSIEDNVLPAELTSEVIQNLHHSIKIVNHSICATVRPFSGIHMSSWASTIDKLCFEKDILFIQASGNIQPHTNLKSGFLDYLDKGETYPNYIFNAGCKIHNPSQSLQALTVGSVCKEYFENSDATSMGKVGEISGFSTIGPGMWSSIKPEVVEFGGDIVVTKNTPKRVIPKAETAVELIRTSPPGPAYDKSEVGTSFSTPKVSYIASQVQKAFPNRSALLYKTLIIQSAKWPEYTKQIPISEYEKTIKTIGYGIPKIEDTIENNPYRVTYITSSENTIKTDEIKIYRVKVPKSIRKVNNDNDILIEITMCYSSDPRRTRKNGRRYLATWVEWKTNRLGESEEKFSNRMIESINSPEKYENENDVIPWVIHERDNWGKIKGISRNKGCNQKDWAIVKAYDLPDEFCIAVIGHKGWGDEDSIAKYELAVSFESINNDIEIYEEFAIEINNEAEIEIETKTK